MADPKEGNSSHTRGITIGCDLEKISHDNTQASQSINRGGIVCYSSFKSLKTVTGSILLGGSFFIHHTEWT